MDITEAKKILTHKEPPRLYDVVEPVLQNVELRDALVEASFDKNETLRYNSSRVLFRALERTPELFYPYWDRFATMIDSSNGFHRAAASQAIAFLAAVDTDCRLDGVLNHYLGLLDDPKVMVTHYFIEALHRICRARPDLQTKVVKCLLGIDETQHLPPRKELLKADVIGVFSGLFDRLTSSERQKALAFVRASVQSESSKTRKAAKSFLAKHEAAE